MNIKELEKVGGLLEQYKKVEASLSRTGLERDAAKQLKAEGQVFGQFPFHGIIFPNTEVEAALKTRLEVLKKKLQEAGVEF